MSQRRNWVGHWLRPFAFTLLIVIGSATIYYTFHVKSQETYFTKRNFRHLAGIASQIGAQVNNVPNILKSSLDGLKAQRNKKDVKAALTLSRLVETPVVAEGDRGLAEGESRYEPAGAGAVGFAYRPRDKVCPNGWAACTLSVKAPIESLVGDVDPAETFDDVFVADGRFEVLYQKNRSEVHLSRFDKIKEVGQEVGQDQVDLENFGGASRRVRVDLGGEEYWLFLQPIHLKLSAAGSGEDKPEIQRSQEQERWIVGGLVRTSTFERATFQISFTLVVAIAFLLLIGLLAWPFLKMWWLGPLERFKRADLAFLTLCGLLAAGVVTVLVLDIQAYRSLRAEVDRDLERLSDSVLASFQAELDRAQEQIVASIDTMGGQAAQVLQGTGKTPLRVGRLLAGPIDVAGENQELPTPVVKYHEFRQLVWMHGASEGDWKKGDQLVKWSVKELPTPAGNYSDRPYFRDAMHRRLLYPQFTCATKAHGCRIEPWGSKPRFTISTIRSRTTGDRTFILSVPVALPEAVGTPGPKGRDLIVDQSGSKEPEGVFYLSSSFPSLGSPLPDGFGFLVVDDDGKILARSAATMGREENFFKEVDDSGSLKSVLFAGGSEYVTVRYHGRAHRAFVRPMQGLDWHLVVLSDNSQIATVNLEIVASTLIAFGMYLVVLAVSGAVFRTIAAPRTVAWLWPDPTRAARAARCALVLAVLAAGALAWVGANTEAPWGAGLAALIALPLAALGLSAFELSAGTQRWYHIVVRSVAVGSALALALHPLTKSAVSPALFALAVSAGFCALYWWVFVRGGVRVGVRYRLAYLSLGCVLIVLVAALPAGLLFRDAFLQSTQALSRVREVAFSRAVDARREAIRETYQSVVLEPARRVALSGDLQDYPCPQLESEGVASFDLRNSWPMKLPRGVKCEPAEKRVERPKHLSDLLQRAFPIYNTVSLQLRHLETEEVKGSEGKADPWVRTEYAGLPGLPGTLSPDWWLVLALPLVIVVLLILLCLRSVADSVLGLDVESAPRVDGARFLPLMSRVDLSSSRILYRVPESERTQFCDIQPNGRLLRVDLRLLPSAATRPDEWIQVARRDRFEVVVLEHLEYRLEEPAFAHAALEILEFLLFTVGKRTLIFSDVDPLYFLREKAREDEGAEGAKQQPSEEHQEAEAVGGASDLARWAAVMEVLIPHRCEAEFEGKFLEHVHRKDLAALLRQECSIDDSLVPIAERIVGSAEFEQWSQAQILDHFQRNAEPLLQRLWALSTREEKFELVQIARDELVNPRGWDVARRLERRGLVKRDPAPRIASESLRWFLLQPARAEEIRSWQTGAPSTWALARIPLFILLGFVTIFFFYTQQDLFDNALGFLAAASAGLPLLLRLASAVQFGRAS